MSQPAYIPDPEPDHIPARSGDPITSFAAGVRAIMGASKVRPVVLELVTDHGPMTHDDVIAAYHTKVVLDPDTPRSSDSGIRTRLSELTRFGLVEAAEDLSKSNYGNAAKQWVAVPQDDAMFAYVDEDGE
jgi:hypothetical protein